MSDEAPEGPATGPGDSDRPSRRKVSEKQIKVIVIVVVVAVLVTVLLWGMVPDKIYELREVEDRINELDGEYVSVKGVIVSWETGQSNFTMADTKDGSMTILVTHTGPIPEGFGINATAVVKGTVHKSVGGVSITMKSDEIQIGCPSKY